MQQFTVPQFIDVEPKIIGPITARQFLTLLAAALLIFIAYKIFDFGLFLVVGIFIFALAGTIAFLKINGRPFHYFILNLIQTFKKPSTRIWNNRISSFEKKEDKEIKYEDIIPNKELDAAKLAELSLVVDTKGKYQGEESEDIQQVLDNDNK